MHYPAGVRRMGSRLADRLSSDTELEGKLIELASPMMGTDKANALLARIWTLEQSGTLP